MSGRHALPSRLGHLYREIAKFGAVGAAGVVVNLAAFNLIERTWHLPTVRASVLATLVAIVGNYVGFRYFAYRDRDGGGRARELTLFLLFSAIGLVIENGVLYVATYGLGWDSQVQSNAEKFAGIALATLFRFWSYRTWVFRAMPEARPEGVAGGGPQEWAGRGPEEWPGQGPGPWPGQVPEQRAGQAPGRWPERAPEEWPGQWQGHVPQAPPAYPPPPSPPSSAPGPAAAARGGRAGGGPGAGPWDQREEQRGDYADAYAYRYDHGR